MVGLTLALLLGAGEVPTLRVGVDTRSQPWVFVPGLDWSHEDVHKAPFITKAQIAKLEGLDIDVLKALARRMGVKTEIVPTAWTNIERDLLAKRFDIILGGWTPSAGMSESIRATRRYLDWGLVIVVRSDDQRIRSYEDLRGLRVGTVLDPSVRRWTSAMGRGLDLQYVTSEDPEPLLDDLRSGKVDAVVYDSFFIKWRLRRSPEFKVVGEPLNHLGYNIGLRAEDTALFDRLQSALEQLLSSGEMERIRKRWEGP